MVLFFVFQGRSDPSLVFLAVVETRLTLAFSITSRSPHFKPVRMALLLIFEVVVLVVYKLMFL